MNDMLERNFNAPPLTQISKHRLVQPIMRLRVTEDAVIHAPVQSLQNRRRRDKIHVRHPKRIQFRPAVVFDATRALSFDPMVKISTHPSPLSLLRPF